jgi:hypothetical protein
MKSGRLVVVRARGSHCWCQRVELDVLESTEISNLVVARALAWSWRLVERRGIWKYGS